MTITAIRITPRNDPRLRAFVAVTFEDCFVVKGMKIIEGKSGRLFLAMPSRKRPNGTYQDLAHPIRPEFRKLLEDQVMAEYSRVLRDGAWATEDRVSGEI